MKNEIRKSVLAEIDLFLQNANQLPREKDIEILKRVRAIWVLSGSGSYLKPLSDSASDQANRMHSWYYATDEARLNYAERWVLCYKNILPNQNPPILIYNGTREQVEDLFRAIKERKYKIPKNQIFIAPGKNIRTIDQVKNFSFPPGLNLDSGYLGVLSHAPHLVRTLRFIGKNREIFRDIKILALPLRKENPQDLAKMIEPEVEGILDYIKKGKAATDSLPYIIL